MKIWHGYGSEHSMNLVMIGHFETAETASKVNELIAELTERLSDMIKIGEAQERFEDDVLDLLKRLNCWNLRPFELEQFLYDTDTRLEDDKIIITTEEFEVSAFFKLMIEKGAKVEIYSAHDYTDTEHGRGK